MGKNLKGLTCKTRKHLNHHGQVCSCYGRITGKCGTPVSANYAASYKKGRKRNSAKGENPNKMRVFGQVKRKMKLGIGVPYLSFHISIFPYKCR